MRVWAAPVQSAIGQTRRHAEERSPMRRISTARRPHVRSGLDALFGGDLAGARQSLVALTLNSPPACVAGGVRGATPGPWEGYPGLLVLAPAAIGRRGNISPPPAPRLSTAIHTGTFRFTARRDTVL